MLNCGLVSGPASSDLIESQLSTVMSAGNAAYNQAMSAMAQMTNVFGTKFQEVGAWSPKSSGAGTSGAIEFVKPAPKPMANIDFTAPTLPEINSNALDSIDGVLSEIIGRLGMLINDMPQFSGVSAQDLFLSILNAQYAQLSAQLRDALAASPPVALLADRLADMLQPGAVGMPASVEQALRDRANVDIERDRLRAEDEAFNDWSARGFPLPGGVLDMRLARIRQDARDKRASANRDTMIEAAKWERDDRQFAVQQGIAFEGMQRDTFLKLNEEARQVAATWQDMHIRVALAAVEVYKSQVEAWGKAADALASMGNTAAVTIKSKLDSLSLYLSRSEMALKSEVARTDVALKKLDIDTRLFSDDLQAESARVDTLVKVDGLAVERERTAASLEIEEQRLELQKLIEVARVTVSALDGIARTGSQLASGAFSSLNMSASIGNTSSYGTSSSCNESHNYQYKAT